jgi:glucosamine--fructose-6-phosphate aminotransferase (isomerizing)
VSIEGTVPSEIQEGPAAIRATVDAAEGSVRAVAGQLRAQGVRRAWVIGNGTSFHSSLHAAGLARRLAGPDDPIAIPVTAGDFRTFLPRLDRGDVVVGISASGEFRDVLGVFEEVRGRVPTVAIVHVPGSSLTRVADHVVLSAGGPSGAPVMTKTFSSTLSATILMLGAMLGDETLDQVAADLRLAATHAERAIADAWPAVEVIAAELADAEHIFVVGGGLAYPAALEAALKLKEMALVHAEASETWEMASGPATIVGPGTVVVSLAPDGPARAATDDVVRHCREWGARVIEVAPSRAVADSHFLAVPADVDERYAPLTVVPPVALLAYVIAGLRGATPDRPSWTERYHSQGLTHIVGV